MNEQELTEETENESVQEFQRLIREMRPDRIRARFNPKSEVE